MVILACTVCYRNFNVDPTGSFKRGFHLRLEVSRASVFYRFTKTFLSFIFIYKLFRPIRLLNDGWLILTFCLLRTLLEFLRILWFRNKYITERSHMVYSLVDCQMSVFSSNTADISVLGMQFLISVWLLPGLLPFTYRSVSIIIFRVNRTPWPVHLP